jgi:AAA domain
VTGRTCIADVVPEQVAWLWPGRIPAGKITTIDGDPGLGKSALALTLAAVVSRGGVWPDGTRCEHAGDVLIMTAEDGVADTIRPRLDAAHADPRRVHVIDHGTGERGEPKAISLGDIGQIERHITETDAHLLIIDVLMAYLPGDAYRDQDVRKALTPLAKLADRTGCAMLLLRHLRKGKGGDPVHSGAGSIGIVGAARAGFVVTRDPDRDDLRIFASVKSNLAICPKSLTYRLIDGRGGAVAVEWLGEDRRSASELFAEARNSLGEMSCRVSDFVNARSESRSGDIAQTFGISQKLANQYLNRLCDGGHVRMITRGVYGPMNGSPEDVEDVEDAEDTEDSVGSSGGCNT